MCVLTHSSTYPSAHPSTYLSINHLPRLSSHPSIYLLILCICVYVSVFSGCVCVHARYMYTHACDDAHMEARRGCRVSSLSLSIYPHETGSLTDLDLGWQTASPSNAVSSPQSAGARVIGYTWLFYAGAGDWNPGSNACTPNLLPTESSPQHCAFFTNFSE